MKEVMHNTFEDTVTGLVIDAVEVAPKKFMPKVRPKLENFKVQVKFEEGMSVLAIVDGKRVLSLDLDSILKLVDRAKRKAV